MVAKRSFAKLNHKLPVVLSMSAVIARKFPSSDASAVPRVGRPPRVNAQAIIEAAIAIGLEGVTLKQVADRLGVGRADPVSPCAQPR